MKEDEEALARERERRRWAISSLSFWAVGRSPAGRELVSSVPLLGEGGEKKCAECGGREEEGGTERRFGAERLSGGSGRYSSRRGRRSRRSRRGLFEQSHGLGYVVLRVSHLYATATTTKALSGEPFP